MACGYKWLKHPYRCVRLFHRCGQLTYLAGGADRPAVLQPGDGRKAPLQAPEQTAELGRLSLLRDDVSGARRQLGRRCNTARGRSAR